MTRRRGVTVLIAVLVLVGVPAGRAPAAETAHPVRMHAVEPDDARFPPLLPTVGSLPPDAVLSVFVDGFPEFARATALQCVREVTVTCGNGVAVQFGEQGTASFQYLVHRGFAGGSCGPGDGCTVVVQDRDGETTAEVGTVFAAATQPPGHLTVSPSTGLREGETVTATASGQPAGAAVQFVVCAAPDLTGSERCGAPGPVVDAVADEQGVARATLAIGEGPVGSDRIACRREQRCGVVVRSAAGVVRTPPVELAFAEPPGAGYDAGRLAVGLSAAALLLLVGGWLLRSTDWAPVGEAAAPEIDDAEYADLDAIIAALPPEELEDVSSR
jgi:Neocarzinostatin family